MKTFLQEQTEKTEPQKPSVPSVPSCSNQPDLFTPVPRHPVNADVAWLENLLAGAKCWMTASDIMLTVGCLPRGDSGALRGRLNDRDVRALASETTRIISGQKGYKHIENATPEEIAHSANRLISQGKWMIRRGIGQRKAAHQRIG
jgi:hypothetical protein